MTQTQFLLLIIALIPLANCFIIKFCVDSPLLIKAANKFFPLLFLINVIGIYGNLRNDNSYLALTEAMRGLSLGFAVDQIALTFLFILGFFWLIFNFYSQRFLQISEARNALSLQFYFTLAISFINLVILSKNLLSTLFFYNCLILFSHFFALKFLHKKETKFSLFFTLLLYLESVFFFLAIVATYKFSGQIDFINGGIIGENFEASKHTLLLLLYLAGLFLSILVPCYLFYRNINLDCLVIYVFFFLSYALSSLYIFLKLLNFIFGLQGFALIINKIGFEIFEIIFLFNFLAASLFLVFSKGLKSSFFYLFFQQFILTLFLVFLFATFDGSKIYLPLLSFFLSTTLVFLCISNIILFLSKSENKSTQGIFYDLLITSTLLIFGIASMAGLAPSIAVVEKFFAIKIIIKKQSWASLVIFLVNLLSLLIFAVKMLYPLFLRREDQKSQGGFELTKNELARNIDFDSSLILTALIVAILIFLGLILFPFLTHIFL